MSVHTRNPTDRASSAHTSEHTRAPYRRSLAPARERAAADHAARSVVSAYSRLDLRGVGLDLRSAHEQKRVAELEARLGLPAL